MGLLPFALTTPQKEARRLHAIALIKKGRKKAEVARELGVTRGAVSQWWKAYQEGGKKELLAKPRSGRPPKLSTQQLAEIPELLLQGAEAHGFENDVWTTGRVAKVIKRRFGVRYSADHVGRLLRRLGFSSQKPEGRAKERDEARIQTWIREDWPRIKKKPSRREP